MLRVMLVDDEPFIMQGLSVLINWNELGFEIVKMAGNGGEAYEYLKNKRVDLIIADISMPVMTGIELLERIREERLSDAWFIILSGYNEFEYARKAIRYACMDYLLKPISREQLTGILARVSQSAAERKDAGETEDDLSENADPAGSAMAGNTREELCKEEVDALVEAIEQNDMTQINAGVDELYDRMFSMGLSGNIVSANISYLQFNLIHLAVELDESVDQEEILRYINENVYDAVNTKGTRTHLKRFALSYAEYLAELKKNASTDVLIEIEKEIKLNYAENLTLKDLSRKYYVNTSYLGQLFRKKYDQSFKDYLSSVRINEAASMLLKTDEKIAIIAEKVGYKDMDYFIQKFIDLKGCTPARYRRNRGTYTE